MPVRKVPGGYKWGSQGKVYKDKKKADADRQAKAIHASQARAKKPKGK